MPGSFAGTMNSSVTSFGFVCAAAGRLASARQTNADACNILRMATSQVAVGAARASREVSAILTGCRPVRARRPRIIEKNGAPHAQSLPGRSRRYVWGRALHALPHPRRARRIGGHFWGRGPRRARRALFDGAAVGPRTHETAGGG